MAACSLRFELPMFVQGGPEALITAWRNRAPKACPPTTARRVEEDVPWRISSYRSHGRTTVVPKRYQSLQPTRGALGCNASVTVGVQVGLTRALAVHQGELSLLNEEQKTARGRVNRQRACRPYGTSHRVLLRLRRVTDSQLRVVSSIGPLRQAAVKSGNGAHEVPAQGEC
jgi:hypothetical protein